MGKLDILLTVYGQSAEQVRYADTKAAIILGGGSVLFVAVADRIHALAASEQVSDLRFAIALVAAVLLALSIVAALVGVYPRNKPVGSRVSWVSIASMTTDDLALFLSQSSEQELLRDLSDHTWELSTIAQAKFKWVVRALLLATVALPPALFALGATSPSS